MFKDLRDKIEERKDLDEKVGYQIQHMMVLLRKLYPYFAKIDKEYYNIGDKYRMSFENYDSFVIKIKTEKYVFRSPKVDRALEFDSTLFNEFVQFLIEFTDEKLTKEIDLMKEFLSMFKDEEEYY